MQRILTIIAIAILLLPGPLGNKPAVVKAGALLVSATPVLLDQSDPQRRALGDLEYLAGWELHSPNPGFGGISSLLVTGPGQILGLSDSRVLTGFHVGDGEAERRPFIAPLPVRPQDRSKGWWEWDSESMAHDPVSHRYWVGFELQQMICRYGPGFSRVEACRVWPEIMAWPDTGSIESLARLPDGRFLAISEMGMTADGRHDALLFNGDPTDPDTPSPTHLRYAPPQGYRPTDAVFLDAHRLLVLNRRLTLKDLFTASIAIVDFPENPTPGAELKARTLARLAPPLLADNFEGIAVTREKGRDIIWVVSDDNHEFFQRTLLLKFALMKPKQN